MWSLLSGMSLQVTCSMAQDLRALTHSIWCYSAAGGRDTDPLLGSLKECQLTDSTAAELFHMGTLSPWPSSSVRELYVSAILFQWQDQWLTAATRAQAATEGYHHREFIIFAGSCENTHCIYGRLTLRTLRSSLCIIWMHFAVTV